MNDKLKSIYVRAEIYKLIIAKDAISQALETAQIVINNDIDEHHELFRPLHDALVINYGKAFSAMNPFGKIDEKWSKFSDEKSQLAHKRIIDQRNKNVGHRDFITRGVMVYQKGQVMPGGDIAPRPQTEILLRFIAPDDFKFVANMSVELIDRFSLAISDQMKALYGEEGEKILGTLVLISQNDSKMIEKENERIRAARKCTTKK